MAKATIAGAAHRVHALLAGLLGDGRYAPRGCAGPCASLEAWNLVLRQQLMVLNRRSARMRLRNLDRLVLVWLYRLFLPLLDAIIIVGEAIG
jgi:hypothetical protein